RGQGDLADPAAEQAQDPGRQGPADPHHRGVHRVPLRRSGGLWPVGVSRPDRRRPPQRHGSLSVLSEAYRTYQCATCGCIYEEAEGLPSEGFPPGTRWEDIPDSWICPDCGMSKAQFDMEVVA